MPEVDDTTLAQYANVDAFVRRGLANPKTRRKLLEVQKTLNPDTPIPEIDESDPLRQEISELRAEMNKREEERVKREQDAAHKLTLAKSLADQGKLETAKSWFEEIVTKYPKTKAAEEAKTLLDKLDK